MVLFSRSLLEESLHTNQTSVGSILELMICVGTQRKAKYHLFTKKPRVCETFDYFVRDFWDHSKNQPKNPIENLFLHGKMFGKYKNIWVSANCKL